MRWQCEIRGLTPMIHNCGMSGLDKRSEVSVEITAITDKATKARTASDENRLIHLSALRAMYQGPDGMPTIPTAVIRAVLEGGARKIKEGPRVRGGLYVESVRFDYDHALGSTPDEIANAVAFTVPVRQGQARIQRTRALFDPWAAGFVVDGDSDLVDATSIARWLDIGGRRVGIGDWRPESSGNYGRFETLSIEPLDDAATA